MTPVRRRRPPLLLGIAGWKNSGKTALAIGLIGEFTKRGLRVSAIKRTHHDITPIMDLKDPSADTGRHRAAGAIQSALVGPDRTVFDDARVVQDLIELQAVAAALQEVDIIVIEGFKAAPVAKIETRRCGHETTTPLAPGDPHIIAVVADSPDLSAQPPEFERTAFGDIADYALDVLGLS